MSSELRPRVAVLGGGLAGIAAAELLALADFDVTLMEQASELGGKVRGWEASGREHEHGVHGFWPNYHGLFALLQRAGLKSDDIFRRSDGTTLILKDGRRYPQISLPYEVPAPFHLLLHLWKAPYLGLADKLSTIRAGLEILAFDHGQDYAEYDGVSFRGWLWSKGVSRRAYEALFEPWVRALTFDSATRVSAAAVLSSFHHYLLRNQHDVEPFWLTKNPRHVFDTLSSYLQQLGVKIMLGAEVRKISVTGNQTVERVGYRLAGRQDHEGSSFHKLFDVAEGEIADGAFLTHPASDPWPAIHLRRRGAQLQAFDSTCPHAHSQTECSASGFRCLAHNSTFDVNGVPIQGPAKERLETFEVRREPDKLGWVVGTTSNLLYEEAEYFVSALDLAAFQKVVSAELLNHELFRGIETLETTPVVVGRFWFKDLPLIPFTSGLMTGDGLVDAYFVLPANAAGEIPVEAQAYLVRDTANLSTEVLRELFLRELRDALPVLRGAEPTSHYIGNYSNPDLFSLYEAGSDAFRPGTETPIRNLFLAGDWVHVDRPVWNMERAVATGGRAARAVLGAFGRNPDDPTDALRQLFQSPAIAPSGRWFDRAQKGARSWRRVARWWRRLHASIPATPTPARHRVGIPEGAKAERRYRLRFRAYKYVGTLRKAVLGMIDFAFKESEIRLDRRGPIITLRGRFQVDLATINTAMPERDERLLRELLKVQEVRYAVVEVTEFSRGSEPLTYDVEFQIKAGPVTLKISGWAREQPAKLGAEMVPMEITVKLEPSTLGYKVLALTCGVVIEDVVEIRTWIRISRSHLEQIGKTPEALRMAKARAKVDDDEFEAAIEQSDTPRIRPQIMGDEFGLDPYDPMRSSPARAAKAAEARRKKALFKALKRTPALPDEEPVTLEPPEDDSLWRR